MICSMTLSKKTHIDRLGEVLKQHEHTWVALAPDYSRVIASGKSISEVDRQLGQKEKRTVVYHKVLPFTAAYAPYATV